MEIMKYGFLLTLVGNIHFPELALSRTFPSLDQMSRPHRPIPASIDNSPPYGYNNLPPPTPLLKRFFDNITHPNKI